MEEIRKIKCPTCNSVWPIKYTKGIENKILLCPKCNEKRKYSEFLPYPAQQDETDLGDVGRFRQPQKQAPGQSGDTEYNPAPQQNAVIGCLKLPGVAAPVKLEPGRNIIGRAASTSTATIKVNDPTGTMSRSHYFIDVLIDGNTVRHILSIVPSAKNNTMLNGIKFEKTDKLILHNGDKIRSGQVEVEFVLK